MGKWGQIFCGIFLSCFMGIACAASPEMQAGFYSGEPYHYIQDNKEGAIRLTGLDVEILKAVAKEAGFSLRYDPAEWVKCKNNLKKGGRHVTAGVPRTEDLSPYVHYSDPYRHESTGLFVLKDSPKRFSFSNTFGFLKGLTQNHFRLGILENMSYSDPELKAFIVDPQNSPFIVQLKDLESCLQHLLSGKIDGFLAERLSGATFLWKEGQTSRVLEFQLGESIPIHMAFSKAAVSPEEVTDFNAALKRLQKTGQFDKIFAHYLHPLLLLQTLSSPWFFILEIIGTIAFAISGLILAVRDRVTIFGATVYAFLPSMGGGILRDILVGRETLGAVLSPVYLLVVIGTVMAGFIVTRMLKRSPSKSQKKWTPFFNNVLVVTDAIGLGTFVVIGVVVATLMHMNPLWLWGPFLAFLTGAGGGILRDMVRKTGQISCFHQEIYAEIAIFWGLLLSLYFSWDTHTIDTQRIFYAVLITILGAITTRLLVYYYKIQNITFRP